MKSAAIRATILFSIAVGVFLLAPAAMAQPQIHWTNPANPATHPGFVGWNMIFPDPVSGQMLVIAAEQTNTSGIYSTSTWERSTSNVWTRINGTGVNVDTCSQDTPTLPGERHPGWQGAMD